MAELYKHNKEIYDGIISAIADGHHKIGYTEATGLGKSFVFAELCNTVFKNKKILYVIPKLAIQDNMYEYSEIQDLVSNVDFTTFASFNSEDNAIEYAEKYEVIFVDECHHLLSDIQGRTVDLCGTIISEKVGCYYIGMSATIEVGRVNVFEKYFTKTVYGLDLYDAIVEGLYPKMKYTIAIPDIQDIPEDVRVKYNIDCSKTMLESILSKNKVRKVLVYFSRVSEIEENIEYIKSLFVGYKVFVLHSMNTGNSEVLHEFNEYNGSCVMLSVSMLLEGVHVNGVDCALIDRNVSKIHTLMQLIGRLYHFGMSESPLVIDMYNSAKLFLKNEHTKSESGYINRDRSIKDIINPICDDYNVIDFINDYLAITTKRYLLEEDYRGIKAGVYSFSRLCMLCGVDRKSFKRFRSSKGIENFSAKFIIDYCFDTHKHRSIVKYSVLKEQYKGIEPCTTLAELSRNLNIPYERLQYTVQNRFVRFAKEGVIKCIDFKDIIDYIKENTEFDKGKKPRCVLDTDKGKKPSYALDIEYRGIKPCNGVKQIAEQCGFTCHTGFDYIKKMKKNGVTVDVFSLIDYLLSLKDKAEICEVPRYVLDIEYKGIKPCNGVKQIAEQCGFKYYTGFDYIKKMKKNGVTVDVFSLIDYLLSLKTKGAICRGNKLLIEKEYRGISPFKSVRELEEQLNCSQKTISSILSKIEFSSTEGLIDYMLDVYIPSHKVTYHSNDS